MDANENITDMSEGAHKEQEYRFKKKNIGTCQISLKTIHHNGMEY